MVATATAYPQYYGHHSPILVPAAPLPPYVQPVHVPVLGRSATEEFVTPLQDEKTARYLINFEAFQRVTGAFKGDDTKTPKWTVTGTASFYQNPFTGTNSKYKIILNGLATGDKYYIALVDDCTTITTEVVSR